MKKKNDIQVKKEKRMIGLKMSLTKKKKKKRKEGMRQRNNYSKISFVGNKTGN